MDNETVEITLSYDAYSQLSSVPGNIWFNSDVRERWEFCELSMANMSVCQLDDNLPKLNQ